MFLPEDVFPNPLTWTWSTTKGADLMWVPIPFERSLPASAYSRTHYGTGYYIYHQYLPGAKLSQPIRAWDGKTPPAADVLDLIGRAGTDIAPRRARRGATAACAKLRRVRSPAAPRPCWSTSRTRRRSSAR